MDLPALISAVCFGLSLVANYQLFVGLLALWSAELQQLQRHLEDGDRKAAAAVARSSRSMFGPVAAAAVSALDAAPSASPGFEEHLARQLAPPMLGQSKRILRWTGIALVGLIPGAAMSLGLLNFGTGWPLYLAFAALLMAMAGLYRGQRLRSDGLPRMVAAVISALAPPAGKREPS